MRLSCGPRQGAFLAASAALLTGCAQPIPKYVSQASGPRAELVMRGHVLPGEAYGVYVFKDALNCTGPQRVGIGVASRDPETTSIDAGLSTAEVFLTKADKSICRVRWSFVPDAGKTYLVAGALTAKGCSARLLDATDPDHMKAETSAQRRNLGGSACSALVAKPASPNAFGGSEQTGEAVLRPGATTDDLQGLIGQ